MTWKQHDALCQKGDLAALVRQLGREVDQIDRECFYIGSINMTYEDHPQVAIAIGLRYIEEYYQQPEPFGSGRPPSGDILKRLILLLDPFFCDSEKDFDKN